MPITHALRFNQASQHSQTMYPKLERPEQMIIIIILLMLSCCCLSYLIHIKKNKPPQKAIYVDRLPENTKLFTLDGTEIILNNSP